MSSTTSRRAFLLALGAAGLGGLTACGPAGSSAAPAPRSSAAAPAQVVLTAAGAGDGAVVGPRPRLTVQVTGGALDGVVVTGPDGASVPGTADGDAWTPSEPLALGAHYTATATARNADRARATGTLAFSVVGEDQAVRAKMQPLDGETVGVGMPVVLTLTTPVPVEQRQALTDAITVDAGGVEGAWRWISPSEVHWRPREYWPAGTRVRVQVPLTRFEVGAGRWGAADRDVSFAIGDAHVSRADTNTHQMTTTVNGKVVKVIPISAGREDSDPHFVTRSGPHVVTEKHADYVMDGATVGLDYTTPVKWATRIANSGEFVHGAPWSVPSQGHANVSHGCLNASDEDAHWFYDLSRRGDVVEVTGTDRPLELTNGLGDWTLSWEQWTSA
jgi:lipoprotein-anchoring transpeptidase ErfK/SrfK